MVKELEKKQPEFKHGMAMLRYSPEGRVPTERFIEEYQTEADEGLRSLEKPGTIYANAAA